MCFLNYLLGGETRIGTHQLEGDGPGESSCLISSIAFLLSKAWFYLILSNRSETFGFHFCWLDKSYSCRFLYEVVNICGSM